MNKIKITLFVFVLLAGLILQGCAKTGSQEPQTSEMTPSTTKPSTTPQSPTSAADLDYFPMDVGREWTYKIEIGKVKPMIYENVAIIKGNDDYYYFPLVGSLNASSDADCYLKIMVKSPYQEAERLMSVELEVLEDDLGIFRFNTKLFWGMEGFSSQTAILQAVEYANGNLMSVYPYPELANAEEVVSERVIFLWGEGRIVQEDKDSFGFRNIDKNVPGYQGIPCWHFLREVHPDKSTQAKSFTEDYWYAPEKGLVRLEQKVEGIISMVWILEN